MGFMRSRALGRALREEAARGAPPDDHEGGGAGPADVSGSGVEWSEAERIDLEHQRDQLLAEVEAIERRLGTGERDYRGEQERKAAAWGELCRIVREGRAFLAPDICRRLNAVARPELVYHPSRQRRVDTADALPMAETSYERNREP